MIELKVNGEVYLINPNNVCFVSLGDGSLPTEQALSVSIYFTDQSLTFLTSSGAASRKLYNRIKKLLK